MFNSIRWNLLVWQAVILLLVVSGSGAWLCAWFRRTTLEEVDSQLLGMAQVISAACSAADGSAQSPRLPREYLERFGRKPDDWPYFVVWDADGEVLAASPAPDAVPPPQRRSGEKSPPAKRAEGKSAGTPSAPPPTKKSAEPGADQPALKVVPQSNGDAAASPGNGPAAPADKAPPDAPRDKQPAAAKPAAWPSQSKTAWPARGNPPPWYHRDRLGVREVILAGPSGLQVLVGKTVHKEEARLAALVQQVLLSGGGVFLLGLTGCWLLARRALRPIDQISSTAESISASNLTRRINLADTKSELGRLAVVLNHTFDRLEAAFQQQVRFTADASHELRTPLAVIAAQAELALARPRDPDQYRQALQACQRAAQRMKPLVEDLLCLSRADAGRLALRREPFDLRACVQRCVEFFDSLAQQHGVAFSLHLEECTVLGDADSTQRAVGNVIDNAVRYNRPGGRVEIRLSHESESPAAPTSGPGPSSSDTRADARADSSQGYAVLTIADTGLGIPAEDVPRVFDRFYRVEAARSRHDASGSGLGLAICKELLAAQGGTVALRSQWGVGTTVEIRLPLASRPAPQAAPGCEVEPVPQQSDAAPGAAAG
jgi:signal transduction histidine kinase